MADARTLASPARSLSVADLRQLWERGQGEAIREVLHRWDEILASADGIGWLEPALRACGLPVEAFTLRSRLLHQRGASAEEWAFFVDGVLSTGDPWWARELLKEAGTASRTLQALHIEVALALRSEDAPALIAAWLQQYTDQAAREAAVDWWIRSGRVAEAERLVEQSDDLPIWKARLALWRRQPASARELLRRMRPSPQSRCLEAVAAEQEGLFAEAEAILRPLLDSEVRGEAASWLCTVLRKLGRYAEVQQAAGMATFASPAFHLIPRLERELADVCERAGGDNPHGFKLRALRQRLALWIRPVSRLENAEAVYPLGLQPRDSFLALEAALERFAGNHSAHLTTVEDGVLTAYRLPQDPRHLGATIQRVLWTRGPDVVRALYRELAPTVDGHPLFRIYQGELELWMGDYEAAARVFRQALQRERRTRWAWIGLGASHMLQGELRQAQQVWQQGLALTGTPGPTLYVYRGECYRRQGDVARARVELETALRQKPQRLSAQINMALLDGEAEALARVERACIEHAPVLMEHLHGTTAERLEKVLQAMRGNRSSSPWHVSYHLWGRLWRRAT